MKIDVFYTAGVICLGAMLAGCNGQTNNMFRPPSTSMQPAAPAPVSGQAAPAAASAAPYVLSAQGSGRFIDFSIYNLGTSDLAVKKEHFALLLPNDREVVPYTKGGAIIDLPQPAVIKPNETIHGRAVFNEINNPIGRRLVFKPDSVGTFADINPMAAVPRGGGAAVAVGSNAGPTQARINPQQPALAAPTISIPQTQVAAAQ